MPRFLPFFAVLMLLGGCGVQGDLYRPSDPKPPPPSRDEPHRSFPQVAPDDPIMPDVI